MEEDRGAGTLEKRESKGGRKQEKWENTLEYFMIEKSTVTEMRDAIVTG